MKTKTALNIIVFVLAIAGVMLKHFRIAGGGIIFLLSIALLLFLLISYAIADNKEAGIKHSLNYVLICALAIFVITLLFRSMHWPGGGILAVTSSILVIVTTGLIVFSKDWFKVSKEFILVLFVFIFALDGLIPNNGWSKLFCIKKYDHKMITAIAPTKMNVLYIGVDNPLNIVVSDVDVNKISVATDNGTIKGEKGEYIANPKDANSLAKIIVSANGKAIDSATFRVKNVPDPVAKVGVIKQTGGADMIYLLKLKEVVAEMENFDFDLGFKVVGFTVSAVINGHNEEKTSNDNQITKDQFDLIKKVNKDQKVYFENIKAVGPDGTIRQLGSIAIKVK